MSAKTVIQTSKRLVTQIITDVYPGDYDDLKKLLIDKRIRFDGILIECKSKRAYIWVKKIEQKIEPIKA
jgi:hypothetical protein